MVCYVCIGLKKFLEKYIRDQEVPPLKLMEAFNVVLVSLYEFAASKDKKRRRKEV